MTLDLSKLVPVGEAMLSAGLPSIGSLLSKVVPFPFSLAVEPLFNAVASALNVDPVAPDAPAQVQAAVQADPAATAAKLQTIEQTHKDMADAANEDLRLRLLDVQDARATEVSLAQTGSPLAKGAAYFTVAIVVMCVGLILIPFAFHVTDGQTIQMLLGWQEALKQLLVLAAGFWLGSSQGSHVKGAAIETLAKAPTVNAGPGSHVSGGVVSGRR